MSETASRDAAAASSAETSPEGDGQATPASKQIHRGEVRKTNQMEAFQRAYTDAIVSASGCTVADWNIDEGFDLMVQHRSRRGGRVRDEFLLVQLKATSQISPADEPEYVPVTLDNQRFETLADPAPSIHMIIVAMIMPRNVDEWVLASHDFFTMRHCMYWTSILGKQPTGREETVVRISTEQVFDDYALCAIMERIRQGGVP